MIKGVLPENRDDAFYDLLIRNGTVLLDAFRSVVLVFAAETHNNVRHRFAEELVFGFIPFFKSAELCQALFFKAVGFGAEAISLFMIKRTHVGFRDGGGRAKNTLLTTTGAGA